METTTSKVLIEVEHPVGLDPQSVELVSGSGYINTANGNCSMAANLILRKSYQWAEFIKDGWWICQDEDFPEVWYVSEKEPQLKFDRNQKEVGWNIDDPSFTIHEEMVWQPPEVSDWRQSKMQKPIKEQP